MRSSRRGKCIIFLSWFCINMALGHNTTRILAVSEWSKKQCKPSKNSTSFFLFAKCSTMWFWYCVLFYFGTKYLSYLFPFDKLYGSMALLKRPDKLMVCSLYIRPTIPPYPCFFPVWPITFSLSVCEGNRAVQSQIHIAFIWLNTMCVTVLKLVSQNLKQSHALGAYKLTLSHKFTVRDILKVWYQLFDRGLIIVPSHMWYTLLTQSE